MDEGLNLGRDKHITNGVKTPAEEILMIHTEICTWIDENNRTNNYTAFGSEIPLTEDGMNFYQVSSERVENYCKTYYSMPTNPNEVLSERAFFKSIKFQDKPKVGATVSDLGLKGQKKFLNAFEVPRSGTIEAITHRVKELTKVLLDPNYVPVSLEVTQPPRKKLKSKPRTCNLCPGNILAANHICPKKILKNWKDPAKRKAWEYLVSDQSDE